MKIDIQTIIDELIPLYAQSDDDLPNQALWKHPDIKSIHIIQEQLINLLFPGRSIEEKQPLESFFEIQFNQLIPSLKSEIEKAIPFRWKSAADIHENRPQIENLSQESEDLLYKYINTLPSIRKLLIDDIKAAYNGDPAALSYAEVKLAYPGVLAIAAHRLSHELYKLNIPLIPRIMSEKMHSLTGIDIHPGASIGRGFFIDHGSGVVIGETSHIGNNVKLYQGVTLGAKSFPLDDHGRPIKHIQRHPTVKDHVIIYANSTILGGDTTLGERTVVAGNVFLMESTPPNSLVKRAESGVQILARSKNETENNI